MRRRAPIRATALAAAAAVALCAALAAGCGGESPSARPERARAAPPDRFDGAAAFRWARRQVRYGPRPAGSRASRRLSVDLLSALPNGRFQKVPGGLRNVIGRVEGRDLRRVVVVGAHYDTKDIPGFVGAVDGASGTAVLMELAQTIRPRQLRPTLVFALFDGEESPRGTADTEAAFLRRGLRGSKVAARRLDHAEAMILLDFVGNRDLQLPREGFSDKQLWARLRAAAAKVGAGATFPPRTGYEISDDHVPFQDAGVPAIDLIDFDFPCWHRRCDDLSQVSERSLDATGESVLQLLLTL
ncbi:MAG TPA: M28 family metallopeptidase [Thermoleophilaceae bacterium]